MKTTTKKTNMTKTILNGMRNEIDRAPVKIISISDKAKALKCLALTRQYIAKGWCKFHWAVNENEKAVSITAKTAKRWCLSAAFICACIDTGIDSQSMEYHNLYEYLLAVIRKKTGIKFLVISQFNDAAKSAKQILDALDTAIFCLAEGK